MKKCRKCNKNKPLKEYYINKNMKDNHVSACKECTIAYEQTRYRSKTKKDEQRKRLLNAGDKVRIIGKYSDRRTFTVVSQKFNRIYTTIKADGMQEFDIMTLLLRS